MCPSLRVVDQRRRASGRVAVSAATMRGRCPCPCLRHRRQRLPGPPLAPQLRLPLDATTSRPAHVALRNRAQLVASVGWPADTNCGAVRATQQHSRQSRASSQMLSTFNLSKSLPPIVASPPSISSPHPPHPTHSQRHTPSHTPPRCHHLRAAVIVILRPPRSHRGCSGRSSHRC